MTMNGKVTRRRFGKTMVATAAAAAFGGTSLGKLAVRKASAQSLRKMTFLFDVSPYGKHALFYPALSQGFFEEEGLDVTFQSGKGSADVALKVAAGAAEAGFADAATSILARGTGAKVKQVMMVHYKAMNNTITLASNPVREPKDLEGRTMGATAGDAPRVALPALAKLNDFDASKVEIITMESPAKPAMLMSKQVEGVFSLAAYTPVIAAAAAKRDEEVVEMLYSDYGLDIYSNGIVFSDELLASDPDLAKSFVRALSRSCAFAVEDPARAIEIFMEYNAAANPEIARPQFDVTINHLMVDEVKKNGIGPMSEDKMTFTRDIVKEFYGLEGEVAVADAYTNDFAEGVKPRI